MIQRGRHSAPYASRRAGWLCYMPNSMQTMARMQPPSRHDFAAALAKLFHRYKEGRASEKYTVNMRNYWTIPDSLMRTIIEGLSAYSASQERFACPLNFNSSLEKYYSPFPEDCVFGACTNAYSCKWTGASQAHPEHNPQDMQKAVKWAIGSSIQASKPSLTTFLLPFDEMTGSAYQQWLGHHSVQQVARIPRTAIRLHQMPGRLVCYLIDIPGKISCSL